MQATDRGGSVTREAPAAPGEHPVRVFVSSAIDEELKPWRVAALSTVHAFPRLSAWAFEYAPPSSELVEESYLRKVRESEFVLWLVGSVTPAAVEAEVREAVAGRKHLLAFLLPCPARDARTRKLLAETRVKWFPIGSIEDFPGVLDAALWDEIARALRDAPGLAPLAQLDRMRRDAKGRCIALWARAGIDPLEAERWASDRSIPHLPSRLQGTETMGLAALVGGMGAGKSLCAERWLHNCLLHSAENPTAPIPVYIAADCLGVPLIDAIRECARDLGHVDAQGANVMLDDLSRCDVVRADRILEHARQVVSTLPDTSVLITSRPIPGLVTADLDWAIPMEPLDEEAALGVVRRAHGGDIAHIRFHAWAPSLREAIRWPLFAVLTGVYLRENKVASRVTYSELLAFLVNWSLRRLGASRFAAIQLLRRLAALSLETKGSLVP